MTYTLRALQAAPVPQPDHRLPVPALAQNNLPTDAFVATVPKSGLDVIFLFHDKRPAAPAARFQLLLRAFCSMQKTISRAAMHEDRIELQIDDARLVIGDTNLAGQTNETFFRPVFPRMTPNSARLAYFVRYHSLALRLRISTDAATGLVEDICRLIDTLHRPKAVILTEAGLVLSRAEFEGMNSRSLARLRKGPGLPAIPKRYARPNIAAQGSTPSPFAASNRNASLLDPARADRIANRLCENKQDMAVSQVFRPADPLARARPDQTDTAPDPFCDAVVFEFRHFRLRILTSLLFATMLLVVPAAQGTDSAQLLRDLLRLG